MSQLNETCKISNLYVLWMVYKKTKPRVGLGCWMLKAVHVFLAPILEINAQHQVCQVWAISVDEIDSNAYRLCDLEKQAVEFRKSYPPHPKSLRFFAIGIYIYIYIYL